MIGGGKWRERALAAEAQVEAAKGAVETLTTLIKNAPILQGIQKVGRTNRLTFIRDGKTYNVVMISTWDDEIEQWRKDLLE